MKTQLDYNRAFSGCLSPVRINDRKHGGKMFVPCRKCNYCLMVRQFDLVERVEREHLNPINKSCFFVTLDYDNNNIPYYMYDKRCKLFISNREDLLNSEGVSRYPALDPCQVDEFSNIVGREKYPMFGHLCSLDLSRFLNCFKQVLRERALRNMKDFYKYFDNYEQVNFRYFAVGEYGPTTFRPHYHLLLWFPTFFNEEQEQYISKIIRSCWSFGNQIDIEPVYDGGVTSYLSSYLNCFNNIPSVLKSKYNRPFCLFTKMPSIGSYQVSENEIREALNTGIIERVEWNDTTKEFVNKPFPSSFFRRYFPKCVGFGVDNYRKRMFIYSYVYNTLKFDWGLSVDDNYTFKDFDDIKLSYFDFPQVPDINNPGMFMDMTYQDRYASLVCAMYCYVFHKTPEEIEKSFQKIYSLKQLNALNNYFELQTQMFENQKDIHNTHSVVIFDLEFLNTLPLRVWDLKLYQSNALLDHGVDLDKLYPRSDRYRLNVDYCDSLRYDRHPDYDYLVSNVDSYMISSYKTKKMNEYKKKLRVLRYTRIVNDLYKRTVICFDDFGNEIGT